MQISSNKPAHSDIPSENPARRLIERAKAWADSHYNRDQTALEPVLIVERPNIADRPFHWRMSQAGPCQGDAADQSIPEATKERFAFVGRMIGAALRAEALVFVTEAWTYIPRRREDESDEQFKARADAALRNGVSRHPEKEERLFAVAEWIENGTVRRTHAFWEIHRTPGQVRVGALVSTVADEAQPTGRLAQWLCPTQPVPDALSTMAQAFLRRCAIADISG